MKYLIIIFVILGALFCRLFVISVYKVSSQSMAPTILAGDFILASQLSYGFKSPWTGEIYLKAKPSRGDLVVFQKNSKIFIKRILAIEGDEFEVMNGEYYINSTKCDYSLSKKEENNLYGFFDEICDSLNFKIIKFLDNLKSYSIPKTKLKESQIFVDRDHRNITNELKTDLAVDSNPAETISTDQIIGKPILIWFSYSSTQDFISDASGIRWNRILTFLK